jgi:probable HAF family extracellular repeat protein
VNRLAMSLFAAVALSIAAFAGAAPVAVRDWVIVDLGTLGGFAASALAVSDSGYIVGCSEVAGGGQHAFIYRDGVMRDLDAASPRGGPSSCASAVNDDGVAAGRIGEDVVIWRRSSVTRVGVEGWAGGINKAGILVGTYKFGSSVRAFMLKRGAIVNLGTLGGSDTDPYTRSEATAINESNQVIGTSNGHAFLYESGTMRDLGLGRANGINDRGEIVGMTSSHGPVPFIYSGVMTLLPGPSYSGALAINDRGQILGSGEGIHGYLLEGGTYTRLDSMPGVAQQGWRRLEPAAINSRGWIVGNGVGPLGDPRAFLLMPRNRSTAR